MEMCPKYFCYRGLCVASQETAAKLGSEKGILLFLVVLWKALAGGLPVGWMCVEDSNVARWFSLESMVSEMGQLEDVTII